MKKNIFIISFVLLQFFLFSPSTAQAWIPDIRGTVKTSGNDPLPGIWVKWETEFGSGVRYAKTDSSGTFHFPPGNLGPHIRNQEQINCITTKTCEFAESNFYVTNGDFGCRGGDGVGHRYTAIVPYNWEGVFSSQNSQTETTIRFIFPNNREQLESEYLRFVWRPEEPLICPYDLTYSCSTSETDSQGNIRATMSWKQQDYSASPAGNNSDVTQFMLRFANQSLTWANDLNFVSSYTGGSNDLLTGHNRNVMVHSMVTQVPIYVTPDQEYHWYVQPGRRDSSGSWWSEHNPVCPGSVVRCEGRPTGTTSLDVNSCNTPTEAQASTQSYVHDMLVRADQEFMSTFERGRLMLEFTVSQDSQLATLIDSFFAGAIYAQTTVDNQRQIRVALWDVTHNQFENVGLPGIDYRLNSSLGSSHAFGNGRTVTEFDQALLAAGFTNISEYADVLFIDITRGGEGRVVNSGWINMACGEPDQETLTCEQVQPQITLTTEPMLYNPDNSTVTAEWQLQEAVPNGVTSFDIYLFDSQLNTSTVEAAGSDDGPQYQRRTLARTPDQTSFSQTMTLKSTMGTDVTIAVRAVVRSDDPAVICQWQQTQPSIEKEITGTFHQYDASINICPESPPVTLNQGERIYYLDGETPRFGTIAGSTYSIRVPIAETNLFLDLSNSSYFCPEAGAQCPHQRPGLNLCSQTVLLDEDQASFWVQDEMLFSGWWQVIGGLVYGRNNMVSNLPLIRVTPTTYVPSNRCESTSGCLPYLLRNLGGVERSAGIPITGNTDIGVPSPSWISERDDSERATNSQLNNTPRENYDYFAKQVNMPANNLPEFISNGINDISGGSTQSGAEVFYRAGNLTIHNNPVAFGNRKVVIFVDGNLTIQGSAQNTPMVTVGQGGFLAFIVKGDVTFNPIVGHNVASTNAAAVETPLVEGMYIADGAITVAQGNMKFVGAGTFVGWGGVSLRRSFDDTAVSEENRVNDISPMELFIHRPDLVVNTPELLRESVLTWQEVN